MNVRTKEIFAWAKERYSIYLKRRANLPKPWTKDVILQQYRFCNTFREDDKVTRWIAKHWRKRADHVWFAMTVARFVNWPETLKQIDYPVPWNDAARKRFLDVCATRKANGIQVFTGAYMVRSRAMEKAEYLSQFVFTPLWRDRNSIAALIENPEVTLARVHCHLMRYEGFGSFLAAQVIADLKYVHPLNKASDWDDWAASGPGSQRGLNRAYFYPVNESWPDEQDWLLHLVQLRFKLLPLFEKAKMPTPHAQDVQNILCEWDKYERVRLGEGRPRSLYPGI